MTSSSPQYHNTNHPYLTYMFLALVFWLPLPFGSDHPIAWSFMELCVFSLALIVLMMAYQKNLHIPKTFHAGKSVFILLALVLLWMGIQTIPLPLTLLEHLSPHAFELASASGQAQYASIAHDPNLTAQSLLKGFSYFTLLALMLLLIDSPKKLKWFAYTILAAGLFQAAYGSYMLLSGIEYSFFMEKDLRYHHSATGTFRIRNHFAGYLEMALAVGIGLMISTLSNHRAQHWRGRLRQTLETLLSGKALIRITLIVICIGLILSKSRMGNTAFFTSLFLSGVLFLLTSTHATRSTTVFLISLIVLDILLVGSWIGLDKVVERIENTSAISEKRDEVARDTIQMIAEQPLTGIGAGNYFSTFPNYQQLDIWAYYYHAHNDYLEFLSEYGVIGFLLLCSAVLYSLLMAYKAMKLRRSPLMQGMAFAGFMGILSIIIHSSVDFNLQIPANAAMFVLLMGLCIIASSMQYKKQ